MRQYYNFKKVVFVEFTRLWPAGVSVRALRNSESTDSILWKASFLAWQQNTHLMM